MLRLFGFAALIAVLMLAAHASAQPITYFASMDGASEDPPTPSPGTGFAQVDIDTTTHMMRVQANFTGLLAGTTAAHIHAPTLVPFMGNAGVATQTPSFAGFPLGVTSGAMDTTFDLTMASSWNPAYITANGGTPAGAEAALATALAEGRAYFNIHTSAHPGGEIRGFLAIPEPGSAGLLIAAGLCALVRVRRPC